MWMRVYEREKREMGRMADWPDTLQEALWNIRGLRGRVRGGEDWTVWGILCLMPYNTLTWSSNHYPLPTVALQNLDPCTPHVTHTFMVGIINWRNGHCFSFYCPKWTWRSLSITVAGKPLMTNTKLCLYWLTGLSSFSPYPTIRVRFHFSLSHPPRGRGGADVCLILSTQMFKHCTS